MEGKDPGKATGMERDDLEALVRIHQSALYRYLRYLGADRALAEDLAQETFLAAFRSRRPAPADEEGRAAAWLRGIARHLFLNHCRRRRRAARVRSAESLDRAEAVWDRRFLRQGDGFDYVEALRRCLERLPDGERRAVHLEYADRRARAEIAALLHMTENGVKSLMRRIRARLAECVHRRLRLEAAP